MFTHKFFTSFAIAAVIALLTGAAIAAERRVALVISNANYEHAPALANPPLDAEIVASALRRMKFDDVEVLRDATADALRKRLRDFALKSRLADVSVIYYAGHGLEAEGQNYLLPVDARLESDLDIAYETVGIDLAVRAVNGAKKLKLLILDACRDNPLAIQSGSDGKPRSFGTGLAPIETAGDVLVSYAAAAGQLAFDGDKGANSPFAKALTDHLQAPGVDVRQVLGRVRDDVLSATEKKQNPFIYASLGGDPVYLVPPPDIPPAPFVSPVVVDLTMADPEEEAVQAVLGEDNGFAYAYELSAGKSAPGKLTPKLDYFVSAGERGRPLIESLEMGYFAPDEGTTWSLAYPLLDIIARRAQDRVITLSELVVEVEKSAADEAPYVALVSPATDFAKLVIFNEGWSDVKLATLEFDILGFTEPGRDEIEALVKSKRDGGYAYKASAGPFQDYAYVSLADSLAKAVPDLPFYQHAFKNPSWETEEDGKPKKPARKPKGYDAWLRAHPEAFDVDKRGKGVWVAGRMIIEPSQSGVAPVVADFYGAVPIYAPEGLGSGAIAYNVKDRIKLQTNGTQYSARKSVGYLLDQDSKTFRGLYPLLVDKTSRHRLRVSLKGDGGKDLYTSEWIDAHIVVPRLSKKAADWAKAGNAGRSPFKGID